MWLEVVLRCLLLSELMLRIWSQDLALDAHDKSGRRAKGRGRRKGEEEALPDGDELPGSSHKDKCASQWREDELVGRCFGIGPYHEMFPELTRRKITTAQQCQRACCRLGTKCITWQVP